LSLDSVGHLYTWDSSAGALPGWPGGHITAHLSVTPPPPPSVRQWKSATAKNASSISIAFDSPTLNGSTLLLALFQYGIANSGGTPVPPTLPAPWVRHYAPTGAAITSWSKVNDPGLSSITVPLDTAGDLVVLWGIEVAHVPHNAVVPCGYTPADIGRTVRTYTGSNAPLVAPFVFMFWNYNFTQSAHLGTIPTLSFGAPFDPAPIVKMDNQTPTTGGEFMQAAWIYEINAASSTVAQSCTSTRIGLWEVCGLAVDHG